jgi:uroporphyrinogen-III synthase
VKRGSAVATANRQQRREKLPLAGTRVLVGRARHQASALSAELRKYGAEVLEIPFIEIRPPRTFAPLDRALKRIAHYDWLILTSVNGVDALFARAKKLRITSRNLAHLRVAAIGPATRSAIEKSGLRVSVVPKEYVAESVVQSLRAQVRNKRVLLVRAKVARDVIPRELRKVGADVHVVEAYETIVPSSSRARLSAALKGSSRPSVITFTSSSTAKNFVALLGKRQRSLENVRYASIGPVTSDTLRKLGMPVHIQAKEYTIPGLVKAIVMSARHSIVRRNAQP